MRAISGRVEDATRIYQGTFKEMRLRPTMTASHFSANARESLFYLLFLEMVERVVLKSRVECDSTELVDLSRGTSL